MNPSSRTRRFRFRFLALAAASVLLWGCIMGGTGSDTENGVTGENPHPDVVSLQGISARVVDGSGMPLQGIFLNLYPPSYRPDSAQAPVSPLADPAAALVTDSDGYAGIALKSAGTFVIEGRSAGQIVFFDTLPVPDLKATASFTFRTRQVRSFRGKVRLASGMRIDSGTVFIRGTARSVKVDAEGGYDLGVLPEDVGRMAVGMRFASSPTVVREVTEIRGQPGVMDTVVVYACNEVPKDSAVKIASPSALTWDSASAGIPARTSLDTSKVNTALKSCDSLPKGSVINVVSPAAGTAKTDSAGVPLLVVKSATPVTSVIGTSYNAAQVVPYAQCVPAAGREKTSFEVALQPSGSGGDLLVTDVAGKCLAP